MRRSFVWLAFAATALLLIVKDTTGVGPKTELQLVSGTARFRFSGPGLPLLRSGLAGKEVAAAREPVELLPLAIKPASRARASAAVWLDQSISPRTQMAKLVGAERIPACNKTASGSYRAVSARTRNKQLPGAAEVYSLGSTADGTYCTVSAPMPDLESAKLWSPNLEFRSLQPFEEPKLSPQIDNGFDLELKFAVKPAEPKVSVGYQAPPALETPSPIVLTTALDSVLSNPGQLLEKTPKLMPNSPWHMPSMWAYPTCITSVKDGLPNGPVDSF